MKPAEDLQKGIQQLVDLTKQDDPANLNRLQIIKMPELSLILSKYFLSLSKLCLTHYHSYAKSSKKPDKSKGDGDNAKDIDISTSPPKKPLTAYILYFQDRVPFFQEKYPKYTISELTRLIAKEWKEIPEESKKQYLEKAALDRKRFENQKKDYLSKGVKKQEAQVAKDQSGKNQQAADNDSQEASESKNKNASEQDEEEHSEGI